MTDAHGRGPAEEPRRAAPPPTGEAPAPGWLVGMFWTLAAWALYYYIFAV